MFELDQEKVRQMALDNQKLIKYVQESSFGFILGVDGIKANMLEIIRQHLGQKTSWAPRFKKSLRKVEAINLLSLAGLVIQMPTLDILEYDHERRTVLYNGLLLRYTKLTELL